jgi:hypothetical protein
MQWSDGRPPAWDDAHEWLLAETIRHDPRWYGLEQSLWTCSLLAGYRAEQTGISLSAERVRVLLHQHGIYLKQPAAVVHSRDPATQKGEGGGDPQYRRTDGSCAGCRSGRTGLYPDPYPAILLVLHDAGFT